MDIATIPNWLWVKNPVFVDFGQQANNTLKFAKVRIQDGETLLSEAIYVAKADYLKADISGFLQGCFDLIPNDATNLAETYRSLSIIISINEADIEIYNEIHTFVYGGSEPLDEFTIEDFVATGPVEDFYAQFLTEFPKYTEFKNMPFELRMAKQGDLFAMGFVLNIEAFKSGVSVESKNIVIDGHSTDRNILKIYPIIDSEITQECDHYVIKADDFILPYTIESKFVEIPGGIYLRWINRLGGVDQYYFTLRDTKRPVKTTSIPLPQTNVFTNHWNKGVGMVVDKEKATVYTVGATNVPVEDYAVISQISQSNRVDMLVISGIVNTWMQVLVNDSDWNTAHENDYQDIEFSITTI